MCLKSKSQGWMSWGEHGDSRGLHNLQGCSPLCFLGSFAAVLWQQINYCTNQGQHPLFALWRTVGTVRLALRWDAMGPLLQFPAKQVSGKERVDAKEKLSVAVFWHLTLFLYLSCNHQNLSSWTEILFDLRQSEDQTTAFLAAKHSKHFQNIPMSLSSGEQICPWMPIHCLDPSPI